MSHVFSPPELAHGVRDQLFEGSFAPGAFIDERFWGARPAIAPPPLKEALRVLCAEGLVEHEPQGDCRVRVPQHQDRDAQGRQDDRRAHIHHQHEAHMSLMALMALTRYPQRTVHV
jgi:DNA-binding FadR family transcriptional regulator